MNPRDHRASQDGAVVESVMGSSRLIPCHKENVVELLKPIQTQKRLQLRIYAS